MYIYLRVDSLCDGIRFGLKSSRWSLAAADFETTSPLNWSNSVWRKVTTSQIDPQKVLVAKGKGNPFYFKEIYRLVKKFMWEGSWFGIETEVPVENEVPRFLVTMPPPLVWLPLWPVNWQPKHATSYDKSEQHRANRWNCTETSDTIQRDAFKEHVTTCFVKIGQT